MWKLHLHSNSIITALTAELTFFSQSFSSFPSTSVTLELLVEPNCIHLPSPLVLVLMICESQAGSFFGENKLYRSQKKRREILCMPLFEIMREIPGSSEQDHRMVKLCRAQLGLISVINSTYKLLMVSGHFSP